MRFVSRSILGILLVAGVVAAASRGRDAELERAHGAQTQVPRAGVVLICLDTLRADSLALDSGRPIHMPRLEAFAAHGVAFADAVAPAAWTGPSVTSLLTGLDPSHTGVNGVPEHVGDLPDSVRTLAQWAHSARWHTAAVTSGLWLVPGTSALRGSTYGAFGLDADPEGVLKRWNEARPHDAPFLLFLHAVAAHDPYLRPGATRAARAEAGDDGLNEVRARRIGAQIDRGGAFSFEDLRWCVETCVRDEASRERLGAIVGRPTIEKIFAVQRRWLDDDCERDPHVADLGRRLRAAYDEGLTAVDATVGRILDGLGALHLPSDTIVAIVGDHGEAFGEHGTLLHGRRLHDEMVRVPMVFQAAGRLGPPRVVHGDAGLVDVVPTLLELMGIATPSRLDGLSLVSTLASGSSLVERPMFAYEERYRYRGAEMSVERLSSIRTTRAKCLVTRDAVDRRIRHAELFDLLVDPGEHYPIPLDAIDRPCEFGDGFAAALEAAGHAMPCRAAAATRTPSANGVSGG